MGDIKSLATSYQNDIIPALEEEIKQLKRANEELMNEIRNLTQYNPPSPEELICVEQIRILQNRSSQRELSLEEVKKLDYLIKNLRLIKDQSTENLSSTTYRDVTEADLVAIASQSED